MRKIALFLLIFITHTSFAQQINISRVDSMPNMPSPYEMRNWKQVALGYDAFVFDFNLTGQYLPLIFWSTNTVNYPNHNSFGLHTVVGTPYLNSAEAINVLPAVISASLVGINKSNQNGYNWVLMCEEFFNKRPEENVYLNSPVASSGSDWWYETMPNVFFYQLYDMYPNTGIGDFAYQFTTVADRWLEAVLTMGGSTTPWHRPYMNYRAWKLSTMTPLATGVPEPEAAGAIAWLLYNAYVETGNPEYRIGAEWCMEFLDNWSTNPSYELQLPYGAYIAARMNAELGTTYDIERLVNWCFTTHGNVRNWGATLGNWGGYDCYGLIGEAKYDGYAFIMNGFEQVGDLVPMVRYDDRFARAIGKWVLNVANATRLFYPNYLPDENQDSEAWAHQYDPNSYIAHESMRESWMGFSPYATGDAIAGGWGATNLALYGSSHVGIFGGIIDTTNVEMILQLDVLKTDYFHDEAYPAYLYFNPYDVEKTVQIDVGSGQHDLYDAVTNSFLQTNVSGVTSFTIPPDAAVLVVLTPAGGTITYDFDKMLVNGVIVDYQSGHTVGNYSPRIKSLAADTTTVIFGENTTVYCTASDRDNDELSYTWNASGGTIVGSGTEVNWTAPNLEGTYVITCLVDDGNGGQDTDSMNIEVVESINHVPVILSLTADPQKIDLGATSLLTCMATDPDDDTLSYIWTSAYGTIFGGDSMVTWTAPENEGYYYVSCMVDDGRGGQTADSIGIVVQDFSNVGTGIPVAYYPFNGNANDESGLGNHGSVHGVMLVADRFGNANSAYYFDGVDDHIRVPSHASLNFRDEISISFWMKIGQFYSREAYPISHGNWENRWKISITPGDQTVRWTIKTDDGIKDLDSQTQLVTDTFYNITVLYDGSVVEIYIDGELDVFSSWSGLILPTTIDLTIGQVLPNNPNYNFKGVLDDIRIYNYALSVEEIQNIYNESASIKDPRDYLTESQILQTYPNPFYKSIVIDYFLTDKGSTLTTLKVYNVLGKLIKTLVNKEERAGRYNISWEGKDSSERDLPNGIYFLLLERGESKDRKKIILIR
jgi:hypothetical protein